MSLEIDYKKLKDLGLTNDGKKKQFCPKCHEKRNNKADKSLSVDWDRCIAHCHHCDANFFFGKTERIGNYQQPKALSTMKEKTYHKPTKLANETMPDEKVLAWFASRGIPAEVVTWRCAWFSPENFPVTLHHPKLIEKLIGKRFLKGLITPIEFETAVNYLSHNFFDILPEEGYRVDTILEKAEALVRRKGIRVFILDPYNCLEHQIPSGQSETQYISEFLEKLRSFARRRQVLVVLAAHPTKMKRDPLTKQFPVPTMYDISGSAAFFNKADFGIAIERDRTKEVTRVHVQKVKFRHLGYPGVASFKYNTHNGRFISIEEGKTPDIPDIVPDYDNSNWLAKKVPEQKRLGI